MGNASDCSSLKWGDGELEFLSKKSRFRASSALFITYILSYMQTNGDAVFKQGITIRTTGEITGCGLRVSAACKVTCFVDIDHCGATLLAILNQTGNAATHVAMHLCLTGMDPLVTDIDPFSIRRV